MKKLAFQDFYPDDVAHCYGCGKLNERGHQIKTYWDGEETVTRFTPKEYHTAIPGFVYGGLIASLIDCHGTGSAAAAMYKHENREMDTDPPLRFVTAQLNVTYLKPTPLGPELILKGKIREVKGKKVIVDVELFADEQLCAKGEVIAVKMPEILLQK
ncbi:MAG: PaaI family thioesterase [Ignavibacteriales bacterium]|jgi:acyl-coenzyme A thioesterase PaaI-like protein|nr:MAG: PaaI family thioesterase [Ignavibacteriales bacterium]